METTTFFRGSRLPMFPTTFWTKQAYLLLDEAGSLFWGGGKGKGNLGRLPLTTSDDDDDDDDDVVVVVVDVDVDVDGGGDDFDTFTSIDTLEVFCVFGLYQR